VWPNQHCLLRRLRMRETIPPLHPTPRLHVIMLESRNSVPSDLNSSYFALKPHLLKFSFHISCLSSVHFTLLSFAFLHPYLSVFFHLFPRSLTCCTNVFLHSCLYPIQRPLQTLRLSKSLCPIGSTARDPNYRFCHT
jgi:hypothetical protein